MIRCGAHMHVKVSVVVPIYNTEKYLEQCLQRIVSQTLKDLEIICVNDGSTDNSLQIIERFANEDDRIKIISKENRKAIRTSSAEYCIT